MKKTACAAALAAGVLAGCLRTADLFLNTEPETQFLTDGNVWLRYLLMLLAFLTIAVSGFAIPENRNCGMGPEVKMWKKGGNLLLLFTAAAGIFCSVHLTAVLFAGRSVLQGHHWTRGRLMTRNITLILTAVLLLLFSVWCVVLMRQNRDGTARKNKMFAAGTGFSTVFYLYVLVRFVSNPSGLHRISPAVDIVSALAALLFVLSFLRALFMPERKGAARAMFRYGMTAFLFCTCLSVPQAVWQMLHDVNRTSFPLLTPVLGCMGLLGAFSAVQAAFAETPGENNRSTEENL